MSAQQIKVSWQEQYAPLFGGPCNAIRTETELFTHAPDLYCPACGKNGSIYFDSCDDYYVGSEHLCVACQSHFYLPSNPEKRPSAKLDALIAHLATQPP